MIGSCPTCGREAEGRSRVALDGGFRCNKCEARARYLADRERRLAEQKARDELRRDERREYQRRYRAERGEEINDRRRQARADDPERFREQEEQRARTRWRRENPILGPKRPTLLDTIGPDGVKARRAAQAKAHRDRDPDAYREQQRAYQRAHADKQAEYSRRWAQRHPDRLRARASAQASRRRARREESETLLVTAKDVARIRARPCLACGATERVQVDHLIPIARGGRHTVGNLVPLCYRCNPSKGAWTWAEWRTSGAPRAVLLFGDPLRRARAWRRLRSRWWVGARDVPLADLPGWSAA